MSIIRVGSSAPYSAGWDHVFGGSGGKQAGAKPRTAKKSAKKGAKKPAKAAAKSKSGGALVKAGKQSGRGKAARKK